ncbi:DUF1328 domain-containing protein [Trinickia fusca]|uniref:DUF1328 domain-containing protein n=1 Tax=Trinickia fusca TaxID=2419777 RepID=A0A494X6D4_9BURK|nr:DUF1328 domain-containing protein [Trinickia fusca]
MKRRPTLLRTRCPTERWPILTSCPSNAATTERPFPLIGLAGIAADATRNAKILSFIFLVIFLATMSVGACR